MPQSAAVDSRSPIVERMAEPWPMIAALVGGTGAMRAAGKTLLPQFPSEERDSYDARLAQAVLFPAFSRTTEVMAAKPLARDIVIEGISDEIEDLFEDVAGIGVTLHAFASQVMLECLRFGLAGVLVDMPPKPANVLTRADEQAAGLRPYLAIYKAPSILGWRLDGQALSMLRLLECVTEPDGDFGEREVKQVRVLTPGAWQIWRKAKTASGREEWAVHDKGTTTLDRIPFVFFYGLREAGTFGVGRPPLLDLAYLNVEHWQSSSDQQNILHVARVPVLFAKGLNEQDGITVGAGAYVRTTSEKADMRYVEHSGAAIAAGRQSLVDLEDRMRQTGAELLVQQPMTTTATQTVSETEGNRSILQRIVEVFEESLEQCIDLMALWLGQEIESEVTMFKDFGAAGLSDQSSNTLIQAGDKGYVSRETVYHGLQRRDIVPAGTTWDEEKARIDAEKAEAPEPPESEREDGAVTPPEDEPGDDRQKETESLP